MEAETVSVKVRNLYSKYTEAIETGNLDEAIDIGLNVYEELLELVKKNVVPSLSTPSVREIILNVIAHYERELSFVKGAREAVYKMPSIYAISVKEKALETLSYGINGLFNFSIGALLVAADLYACMNLVSP
ncbi:MAG: hypothetical protein QXY49_03705 [Thermofilaceae archaeon]